MSIILALVFLLAGFDFGLVPNQVSATFWFTPTNSPEVYEWYRPTVQPTAPTKKPSPRPTRKSETFSPTTRPSSAVPSSAVPTTRAPSASKKPTTALPSSLPTRFPSARPSNKPSLLPSQKPTRTPTLLPSQKPSRTPTLLPSKKPTRNPTLLPSKKPSKYPTLLPSKNPSKYPTLLPSKNPSLLPSLKPSTLRPSRRPSTAKPTTQTPTSFPTFNPATTWTQLGSLFYSPHGLNSLQGSSVSTSHDGLLTVCGAFDDDNRLGGAWVFLFFSAQNRFLQLGPKLFGSGAVGENVFQGFSVSISSDASTIIIGGPGDNNADGAAWVFHAEGASWLQQGPKLVGTGANTKQASQGTSVALSADGSTAIVGGPNDNAQRGAAWIFVRQQGSVWSQQGNKLVGTGFAGVPYQGTSVSISHDGNTVVVGGPNDAGQVGAIWVFVRAGNPAVWSQQGQKLVGTGFVSPTPQQGYAVAISGDGLTLVFGGPGVFGAGAAWVFTRPSNSSGAKWSQQGSKLVGAGSESASQGYSVSISANGNTVILGGPQASEGTGAAWVFTRAQQSQWFQQGGRLVGSPESQTPAQQGNSVSLSGDGNRAVIGGPEFNSNQGAVWMFERT